MTMSPPHQDSSPVRVIPSSRVECRPFDWTSSTVSVTSQFAADTALQSHAVIPLVRRRDLVQHRILRYRRVRISYQKTMQIEVTVTALSIQRLWL